MKHAVLNCLVVDDEPLARKVLADYINESPGLELIQEFKSAVHLKHFLDENMAPDIIFLDINMPKLSGLEFVKSFDSSAHIVFTTAYPEFAVDAFELNAADYLLKPVSYKRFLQCIDKLRDMTEKKSRDWIVIKENKRLYKISYSKLLYLQAYGDYVKFITPEKNYITKAKLSEYVYLLGDSFQQCHRSYIANLSHVRYMEGNQLVIGEDRIPVSSGYRDSFLEQFS